MNVIIEDQQSDLKINQDIVKEIVNQSLILECAVCDEVYINFVDTTLICKLHKDYFNDASTTDCISFPMDEPQTVNYCVLGEIYVCPKTAIEYANENNLNPYLETTLYIIHGLLHLLGYSDNNSENIALMREKEQKHMQNLKLQNILLS